MYAMKKLPQSGMAKMSKIEIPPKNRGHSVLKFGIKALGRGGLEKFLQGGKITRTRAIEAKCYDCMGGYADGTRDCESHTCPLHPFHPYNSNHAHSKAPANAFCRKENESCN